MSSEQLISAVFAEVEEERGLSLDWVFHEATLLRDMRRDLLEGVRRLRPQYAPLYTLTHDTPNYNTHLLNGINTMQVVFTITICFSQ